MKKVLLMAITATVLLFASCSKKDSNDNRPDDSNKNTVTIGGSAYATVAIGTQTWIAVNYNGPGGVNYAGNPLNDATIGKLYTIAEAKAVKLPDGWRLPSADDYTKLYNSQGADAKKLMAKTSWSLAIGNNSTGFNAYAAGYYEVHSTPDYDGKGTDAVFITTSILPEYKDANIPASFVITQEDNAIKGTFSDYIVAAEDRGSIRFVKDN